MRIAFMGTPDFAVPTLDALIEDGHEIVAAIPSPRVGPGAARRLHLPRSSAGPKAAGIEVRMPVTLRDAGEQRVFAALDLDVAVVAAYGLILPEPILAAP
jgi:methionyl-tRNA formyltransferase